jgi:hypothetical protein
MRATEFIRGLLDLIDNVETQQKGNDYEEEVIVSASGDQDTQYSNSPDTFVAYIKKVTVDAGGGVNGPKHPADVRSATVAMNPNLQYDPRNR